MYLYDYLLDKWGLSRTSDFDVTLVRRTSDNISLFRSLLTQSDSDSEWLESVSDVICRRSRRSRRHVICLSNLCNLQVLLILSTCLVSFRLPHFYWLSCKRHGDNHANNRKPIVCRTAKTRFSRPHFSATKTAQAVTNWEWLCQIPVRTRPDDHEAWAAKI